MRRDFLVETVKKRVKNESTQEMECTSVTTQELKIGIRLLKKECYTYSGVERMRVFQENIQDEDITFYKLGCHFLCVKLKIIKQRKYSSKFDCFT